MRRRRLSESNQPNEDELVQTQEENHILGTNIQMVAPIMLDSNQKSIQDIETGGLTDQMGYAQDQTISMEAGEDNFSLFDSNQDYFDDNICFDADELLTSIQTTDDWSIELVESLISLG